MSQPLEEILSRYGRSTGRIDFAQVRYEMEKAGEPVDKFSVWKRARDLNEQLVQEIIKLYEKKFGKAFRRASKIDGVNNGTLKDNYSYQYQELGARRRR